MTFSPAPGVHAAPAPVVEYISPVSGKYSAPQSVGYIALASAPFAATALVGHISGARHLSSRSCDLHQLSAQHQHPSGTLRLRLQDTQCLAAVDEYKAATMAAHGVYVGATSL